MQDTFLREEYKYRITGKEAEQFLKKASVHLSRDAYPEYNLHSIYFDTNDFQTAAYCLDKHAYKDKLRLRIYGDPQQCTSAYLEIKKKYLSLSSKRRTALSMKDAEEFLKHRKLREDTSQIDHEISSFLSRNQYEPRIFIACHRKAFAGRERKDLRVTLDSALCFRDHDLDLSMHGDEVPMTGKDEALLEIKAQDAMPLWLVQILSEMKIYRASFSKYSTAYKMLQKNTADFRIKNMASGQREREDQICSLQY